MSVRLPAEWEPQSGVLLSWPHTYSAWWDPWRDEINRFFTQLTKIITRFECVIINYYDANHLNAIRSQLIAVAVDLSCVHFCPIPTNDVWVRDHGPITVFCNEQPILLSFIFNGWGEKYPSEKDNEVPLRLYRQAILQTQGCESINFVLEGGSIDTDGQGSLLTTMRCLHHRNPHLTLKEIEMRLRQYLGVNKIFWLKHGFISGDDTEGHVDTLARFTDAHTICYVSCRDPIDEHYHELQAMEAELEQLSDLDNKPYRLIPLPLPQPILNHEGRRLPATYANFLIINHAVLMPTYNDPADEEARKQLQICFPDREIIGIPARVVIQQYGSLHCVTMQLPLGMLP